MAREIRLNDDDVLAAPSIEDHRADPSPARAALDRANALLDDGKADAAADLCRITLRSGALAPLTAANLIMVLRAAGGVADADRLEADLLAQLRASVTDTAADAHRRINLGRLVAALGRNHEAADLLTGALPHAPTNMGGVMALTAILLRDGDPEAAIALWQPVFDAARDNGKIRLNLVRILAQAGCRSHALQMLDLAAPLCGAYRHEFDYVAAALRGTDTGNGQAAMTLEVFDHFARDYDNTLEKLGNRGPKIVGAILRQLDLPRGRHLSVLDAGCGTGLCGPMLRPYARRLHGVDLSATMLAEARKKRRYDALSRADLSSIGTYPAGPFDLIASSDVLVYFGDLAEVLANFSRVLRPGGWLVLTVEDAGDATPPRGWALTPSGRHRHGLTYLQAALRKAGFGTPTVTQTFDLRHEFGQPVRGLGLAAQRLALFG